MQRNFLFKIVNNCCKSLRLGEGWRIYYHEIKFLIECRDSKKRRAWHQRLNVLFATWLIRLLVIWVSVRVKCDRWFQFDYLARSLRRVVQYDSYVILSFASLFLFAILHNTFLYYTSKSYIWQLVYQLVVVNTDDFTRQNQLHNKRIRVKNKKYNISHGGSIKQSIETFGRMKQDFINLWRSNRYSHGELVAFRHSIRHFPFISAHTRVRTFLLLTFAEVQLIAIGFMFVIVTLVVMLSTLHYLALLSTNWSIIALIALDIALMAYLGWSLFKLCAIAFLSHIILLYVFKSTFFKLDRLFQQTLLCMTNDNCYSQKRVRFTYNLYHLQAEHARITRYIFDADSQFWSTGSFIMFFTNIPINVYFVTYLYFRSVELSLQVVLCGILLLQTTSIIETLSITANVCTSAHNCSKYLFPVQVFLTRRWIALKIKCDQFYEQLTEKRKIAFTVASLGMITKEGIFQFVIVYLNFYIYAARLVNSSKKFIE